MTYLEVDVGKLALHSGSSCGQSLQNSSSSLLSDWPAYALTGYGVTVFVLRFAANEDWRERRGSNP
jgi:hypothetical protein